MRIRINKLARILNINGDVLSQHVNELFEKQIVISPNTKLSITVVVNNEDDVASLVKSMSLETLFALKNEVDDMIEKKHAIDDLEKAIVRCSELGIDSSQYIHTPLT